MSDVVLVVLEERFKKDVSGRISSNVFNTEFWKRYLDVFNEVVVVARIELIDYNLPDESDLAVINGLSFQEVPFYKGGGDFFKKLIKLLVFLNTTSKRRGVFVLRLPGLLSALLSFFLITRKKVFAAELVGDPDGIFGNAGVGGRIAKVLKYFFVMSTKLTCRKACAVSYVSLNSLLDKYPSKKDAFVTSYSSIDLKESLIVDFRDQYPYSNNREYILLAVGSLEQRYKGFGYLIKAFSGLYKKYPNLRLKIVGGGAYLNEYVELTNSLNLSHVVFFSGALARRDVMQIMDEVDLFIIPSLTEGLPRALIEACARGLPCLGSDVGGIPEILNKDFLFRPKDPEDIIKSVDSVINNPEKLLQMSQMNIATARQYRGDILAARRKSLYLNLKKEGGNL